MSGIFSRPAPRLFTIEAGRPFASDLAAALTQAAGGEPLALTDAEIHVPTRRAVRTLTDAFAIANGGAGAALLPRIRALGDVDEDEFLLEAPAMQDAAPDLPPAASMLERRLTLARLVAAGERVFNGQENWPAALAAARELSALLDSFYAEEIPFDALHALSVENHAEHWNRSLAFLRIATEAWPAHLEENGRMDPAARRSLLIRRHAERLAATRPQHPVIVAGTTGSSPAVAALMNVVAQLPRGAVVLPGLDRALAQDARAWAAIEGEDAHPQAGLRAVLDALGVAPGDVAPLPGGEAPPRARLLSLALRPAEATDDWLKQVSALTKEDPKLAATTAGLTLVEAGDEEAEAQAIALLFREALEMPARTALLVTPDRNLARRVAQKMLRWDVTVDDSGGVPFANTPCGVFLRLAASWMAAPGDPVATLALAKHPLAGFGLEPRARATAVSALDRALRGLAPPPGVAGLRAKVDASRYGAAATPALDALERALASAPAARAPFAQWLGALVATAETLAADDALDGPERLWRGDDGEAGALLLSELRAAADALGELAAGEFPAAFSQMISGAAVRRRAGAHPRLTILGPLEARLQSADLVILGGLNEGVWPADPANDPFLSRPMRRELGLPSPERRIGLAAHDFAQLAAAPEVVLSRAARAGGAPTKPSRWIVRLKNILKGAKAARALDRTQTLAAWGAALDAPAPGMARAEPPKPTPPLASRPRRLSVTRIERWIRDPYAIYAQYILGLYKLDPLAEPFGARNLGNLFHEAFDVAVREGEDVSAALARLAPKHGLGAAEAAFHGPAIDTALAWFRDFHAGQSAKAGETLTEAPGELALVAAPDAAPFTIHAVADRIDVLRGGSVEIFDYKTRSIPSADQAKTFRVQLPLTALIAEQGGFEALGPRGIDGYAYIRVLGRKKSGNETGASGPDAIETMRIVEDGLRRWIAAFDDPSTPYLSQPRPEFVDEYGDYDILARRREWSVAEDGE